MTAATPLAFQEKHETSYCVPLDVRDWQIRVNTKKVRERLKPQPDNDKSIAIVGFAPSLKNTYQEIKNFKNIITCSGAHKFLLERGFTPEDFETWYHLDVDPRPHKVELLGTPRKGIIYLPTSCIHPTYIDKLQENNVEIVMWHVFAKDGESDQVIPRGEWSVTGGSDAGMRCMSVARVLGYKDFHIFGMDGCDSPQGRHADRHPNEAPGFGETEYNGKKYITTPSLLECGKQVFHELTQLPDVTFKFYGEGLIQAQAKDFVRPIGGQSHIAIIHPELISEEMKEQNRLLHEQNAFYGRGGEKYAEIVKKMKTEDVQSILDYGCGKGTLAKSLPFPIWEYDPGIPGKDELPKPADLVVCTDVLEHIEPDKLGAVLEDLQRVTLKFGYFVIHLGAAKKTYPNGKNAHLIQKDANWWTEKLKKRFSLASVIQKGNELHVIVTPKLPDDDPIVAIKKDGYKVRFYTPNDTTRWRAESLLSKEPCTIEWIDSMEKGDILYDIGANVGGYTCYAGVRGIKVFAFEPEAENYALLNRNIRLNNLDVTAYNIALSDRDGLSELFLSQQGAGGSCHSYQANKDFNGNPRGNNIRQGCVGMALDSLELPSPTYIKLDVDGFEHLVIKGGFNTLKKVQSLLVELNPNIPEHLELRDTLVALGFYYDEDQVEKARRKEGAFKGVAEHIFYRPTEVEKHLVEKIEKAELVSKPFPHFYIEDVFPKEYYNRILEGAEYKPITEVRNTAYPDRFVSDKQFPELRRGLLKKALLKKFNTTGTKDETLLIKDRAGYAIGPHTDLPQRACSAIFYLAKDDKHPELGTSIYVPKKKGFTCDGMAHHPFDKFKKVQTLAYKPNTALFFQRTDNSFHGVEKTEQERDVLLYDIRA